MSHCPLWRRPRPRRASETNGPTALRFTTGPASGTALAPLLLAACALLAPVVAPAAEGLASEERLPWALREHYTITREKADFVYGADCAEWKLEVEGIGAVVESAKSRVVLEDGTVLDPMLMSNGTGSIKRFETDFGPGVIYSVEMPPQDGLVLRHSASVHRTRAFNLLRLEVRNEGSAPVRVASIEPALFEVQGLSPSARVGQRNLSVRGPYPVPVDGLEGMLAVVRDPGHGFALAIGCLPMRVVASTVTAAQHAEGWRIAARSTFDPPVEIGPGESLECDPVWLTVSVPTLPEIDMIYAWTHSILPKPDFGDKMPWQWVTVGAGAPASDLYAAAESWKEAGVRHALVPPSWEAVPGSLTGARPAYPKDMAEVAAALKAKGATPGLTIDPLAVQSGDAAWSAVSADGQRWLNPGHPEGLRIGANRLRQVVQWGFEFFVVERSPIPDEVLRHFNLTRLQADAHAFRMMSDAAPGLPVLPAAAMNVPANVASWLSVSAATSRLREYRVPSGPVRFRAGRVGKLDDALLTAMLFYGGPVEFVGRCAPQLRDQLAGALSHSYVAARPLTVTPAPKLWHVLVNSGDGSHQREGVVMFPGAPSWGLADVGLDKNTAMWRAQDGEFLRVASNPLEPAQSLTVVSLLPDFSHPTLLGLAQRPGLHYRAFHNVRWDPAAGRLSGNYAGPAAGTVCVAVPPGWTLKGGEAGGKTIRGNDAADTVAFDVQQGRATFFELTFKRE